MINNNKNDWAVISPAFQWAQGMNDVPFSNSIETRST